MKKEEEKEMKWDDYLGRLFLIALVILILFLASIFAIAMYRNLMSRYAEGPDYMGLEIIINNNSDYVITANFTIESTTSDFSQEFDIEVVVGEQSDLHLLMLEDTYYFSYAVQHKSLGDIGSSIIRIEERKNQIEFFMNNTHASHSNLGNVGID